MQFGHKCRSRQGDLIKPIRAVHDPDVVRAEILQHLCQWLHPLPREHTDHLARDASRVRQRPEQVEDRAGGEFDAGRADILHRRVVRRREHEADAGLAHTLPDLIRRDVDPDAERGQHVSGPRTRRQCPVTMLGDGHAAASNDERRAGRDVDRTGAIAAGSDHIDGIGGRRDAQHLGAHGGDRAGDFFDGLATHPQRHQEAAHLRGRRFAGHHAVEGGSRLVTGQRRAGGDLADQGFEVVHHGLSAQRSTPRHFINCSGRLRL